MPQVHERTQSRKAALQLLYSAEITQTAASVTLESGVVPEDTGVIDEYARALVAGVEENRAQLDAYIDQASENWALKRIPIVDHTVLQIALYEMLYVDDVPVSVSINEAVELAKDFCGADDSHRFVNGVLGNIAKQLEGQNNGE